jgi:hypothetical protein
MFKSRHEQMDLYVSKGHKHDDEHVPQEWDAPPLNQQYENWNTAIHMLGQFDGKMIMQYKKDLVWSHIAFSGNNDATIKINQDGNDATSCPTR